MRRTMRSVVCLSALFVAALLGRADKAPAPDEAARAAAIKLFNSLSDEQKKLAVKEVKDKDRYAEIFPAVERAGLSLDKLSADQKSMVDEVLKAMTSEYGASRCLAVAKQTGGNRTYVNFFGTPGGDAAFAWRLATHHLTLIYAEFGKEKSGEFGPVLLGGNPVKELWDAEEKVALELVAALSPDEAKTIKGKGNAGSGADIGNTGIAIGDLSEKPRALAKKLLEHRLGVFSADRRKVLDELIQRDGGIDKLRIAFWGEATKSQHDGGNYHWKIGGAAFLCDWQTAGKEHLHITVRARNKS